MKHHVVLIPGDGIGPEITKAALMVVDATGADIEWITAKAGRAAYKEVGNPLPEDVIDLIREYKVALKGPLETPIGTGYRSVNVALRRMFNLFAIIRPVNSIFSPKAMYDRIDLVLIREGVEGLYVGIEHYLDASQMHTIAIRYTSRHNCKRLVRFAFDYAIKHKRKKVTLVHKANILKITEGILREEFLEASKLYPNIHAEDILIDSAVTDLVREPMKFDVIVTSNMFGDILSGVMAGLIGSVGVIPSANIGEEYAIFETAHGTAPEIAGRNIANPTAMILSSAMLLDHIGLHREAQIIKESTAKVIQEGKFLTRDVAKNGRGVSTLGMAKRIAEVVRNKIDELD